MKKAKLLTLILIPVTVSVMAAINVSAADGAADDKSATTNTKNASVAGEKTKVVTGSTGTKEENTPTAENENKAPEIEGAKGEKPSVGGKDDNTIGIVGLGLSILNIIGLGVTFWLNKEAINKIQDKTRSSDQKIDALKSRDQSLDSHIKKVDGDRQSFSDRSNREIEGLKRSIEELSRKAASVQQTAPMSQSNYRTERQSSSAERHAAAPVNIQLSPTDYYNDRQSDFQHKYQITPVSREAENLNQSRAAQTTSVVLAGDRQGNYWLFSDNSDVYLVPKQNLKITDNRISNTKDLFECQDYTEQDYDNFSLIKPAVLTAQGNGTWQLKEKGKLQFG